MRHPGGIDAEGAPTRPTTIALGSHLLHPRITQRLLDRLPVTDLRTLAPTADLGRRAGGANSGEEQMQAHEETSLMSFCALLPNSQQSRAACSLDGALDQMPQ